MKKQLIIGLGTGRCGTVSLYKLLDSQKNSNIDHESKPLLTWSFSKEKIDSKLSYLFKSNKKYIGDVAFYYLPYTEYILKTYPNAKFICLKRDKKEVVRSYLKKTKGKNHWIKHLGKKWNLDREWDKCFPKYNLQNKERAIENFWGEYYKKAKKLVEKYPENFKIFNMNELNNKEGVKKILDFCNIDKKDRKIITNFKENSGDSYFYHAKYLLRKLLKNKTL